VNHGILDKLASKKCPFIHVRDVFLDALDRFKNMPQVIGNP
jgi:hypothetical protein